MFSLPRFPVAPKEVSGLGTLSSSTSSISGFILRTGPRPIGMSASVKQMLTS